jgi:hypothetical protein
MSERPHDAHGIVHGALVTPSGGRGNGKLRLRNYGLYFLFTFLFVAYSSLRVTPCNSGLSPFGPALPFQPRLQGGPDLISSAAVAIAKM